MRIPSPERLSSIVQPIVLALAVVFAISVLYGYFMNSDYEEDDTVTFTFDCSGVLKKTNAYPSYIVEECEQIRNENKRRNRT